MRYTIDNSLVTYRLSCKQAVAFDPTLTISNSKLSVTALEWVFAKNCNNIFLADIWATVDSTFALIYSSSSFMFASDVNSGQ